MALTTRFDREAETDPRIRPVRLAVVGCGDVLHRHYLGALAAVGTRARVVGVCDIDRSRAVVAASACSLHWPGVRVYDDWSTLLEGGGADAVVNLTPAPLHADVSMAALEAGAHVYSEKPVAASVSAARRLIAAARRRRRLLLCAPAVVTSPRFQWLRELIGSGRIGEPTLVTAQIGNLGPASWRAYTGDARVHYSAAVGPLLDQGVYVLHAITGLLGPAGRVQAVGRIAMPARRSVAGRAVGQRIAVCACDHVLLHVTFPNDIHAQVLASFAIPGSKVPSLEVHATLGSVTLHDVQSLRSRVDVFLCDESPLGLEGWIEDVELSRLDRLSGHVVRGGVSHFIGCIDGDEQPLLTGEHATHVLEIALAAERALRDGCAVDLETEFDRR